MTVDDGRDLQNDPFGPNFFPLLQTLAPEGLQLRTAMEFDAIDSMLRSRALKDPSKFLEQANAVLSSNLDSAKFEDASLLVQAANANGVDNQQKRRPALGLRRAKFSFKPIQSQPVPLPDPVLSIDHLKDPDEFFAAYERLENAEKELKKSRGDALVDPFEQPKDRKARPRRQGILGKMANYKHIYPKSAGEVNLISSQEEMSNVSHFNMTLDVDSINSSQPESATQPGKSRGAEMANVEVVAATEEKENQINVLLEELLSTCVDLDGGEMVSLLQDRLHVKPVALDELSFPDLDIIQRNDIKASEESQSRPRKALSDLQQGLRLTANGKTPMRKKSVTRRHKDESFRNPQSSPTPPRSPFASLSMLTKRILQVDPPSDPFALPVEADVQAEFSCSLQGKMDKEALSHPVSPEKGSLGTSDGSPQRNDGKSLSLNDEMHSKMVEECNATDKDFSSEKVSTADLPVSLDPPMENNSSRFDFGIDTISKKGDACSQDKVKDVTPEVPLSQELESSLNLITGTAQCSEDQPERDLLVSLNTPKDSMSSRFDIEIDTISNEGDACSQDKPQVKVVPPEVPLSQELESSLNAITGTTQCSEDQPEPGTCLAADGRAEGHSDFCGQHDKPDQEAPSKISWKKREKVNELPGKRTKKARLRGQSLAAAGTKFESGVRRSSRMRSRPLEYWRGERFLYGRIHESLPTIIGIKNASPGKGEGEPVLKVKSFVSEKYAALVELSGLH